MVCSPGTQLLIAYQEAVERRANARDLLLLSSADMADCEEALALSKAHYFEALSLWINHRGTCAFCRSSSMSEDRLQFASV